MLLLAATYLAAFAFGLVAREAFDSRAAGAVAFLVIQLGGTFLCIRGWSSGLKPGVRTDRLVLVTGVLVVLALVLGAVLPQPFGAFALALTLAPALYLWSLALPRRRN